MTGDGRVKRRQILKSVGATATASTFSDPIAAKQGQDYYEVLAEAAEPYESPNVVEQLINENRQFLTELTQDGVLAEPRIEVDELLATCEYVRSVSGATVWGLDYPGGVPAGHITVRRRTPAGNIVAIALTPDVDQNIRAIVKPSLELKRGDSVTVYSKLSGRTVRTTRPILPNPGKEGDGQEETPTTAETTTNQPIVFICRNAGSKDDSCNSLDCWSWETRCDRDNECTLIDCTGNQCCGGCCCCEDQGWCCEVCGDLECEGENRPVCAREDHSCPKCVGGTGCCSDGEGSPHPDCRCEGN